MTTATATLTRDEAAALLTATVKAYRADDLVRLDPYWEPDSLDAFAIECFGVPVDELIGLTASELMYDWRDEGAPRISARVTPRYIRRPSWWNEPAAKRWALPRRRKVVRP